MNLGTPFREAVARELKARDWTHEQLARRAKLSRPALTNVLTGRTKSPREGTVAKIARAFGWGEQELAAALAGELPAGGPDVTLRELEMAKQILPRAPEDALRRYAILSGELRRLTAEVRELQREYGQPIEQG